MEIKGFICEIPSTVPDINGFSIYVHYYINVSAFMSNFYEFKKRDDILCGVNKFPDKSLCLMSVWVSLPQTGLVHCQSLSLRN